jgi:hypothetical protein
MREAIYSGKQAGAAMLAHINRFWVVIAALAVGAIFVLTVRTAGLHELGQRSNCAARAAAEMHSQACRSGEPNGPAER